MTRRRTYRTASLDDIITTDKKLWDVELFAKDIGFFKIYDVLADDEAGAIMVALANLAPDEQDSDGIGPYAVRRDRPSLWAEKPCRAGHGRFRSLWHSYTRREHHEDISPGVDVQRTDWR